MRFTQILLQYFLQCIRVFFSDKHYMFPPNWHLRLISSKLSFNTGPTLYRGKKLEVCILNEFCPNRWFFVAVSQYHANLGQLWRNDNTRQTLSTTSWKWGNSKSSNVWNIYFGFLCCALSLQSFLVYTTYYARCICACGGFKKIQDRSKKWDHEPLIWASHAFLNSEYLCMCGYHLFQKKYNFFSSSVRFKWLGV